MAYVTVPKDLTKIKSKVMFNLIMKKNKYIAAVEVRKHEIIQAHTYGNGDISENKSLKKAFDIWRNRNMLDDGEKSQVVR